jgi:hypothetical protein
MDSFMFLQSLRNEAVVLFDFMVDDRRPGTGLNKGCEMSQYNLQEFFHGIFFQKLIE